MGFPMSTTFFTAVMCACIGRVDTMNRMIEGVDCSGINAPERSMSGNEMSSDTSIAEPSESVNVPISNPSSVVLEPTNTISQRMSVE